MYWVRGRPLLWLMLHMRELLLLLLISVLCPATVGTLVRKSRVHRLGPCAAPVPTLAGQRLLSPCGTHWRVGALATSKAHRGVPCVATAPTLIPWVLQAGC